MTIKALVRRPIKRHIRRSVRRAVDLRDYFANDEEGFLGSSAFANLYATYLQAANVTAYGDATGFVKNTLPATDKFLILSGASGVYASTPDDAAIDGLSALEVIAYGVRLRDFTPAANTTVFSKYTSTGNQCCVVVSVTTTGTMQFVASATGSSGAQQVTPSSVTLGSAGITDAQLIDLKYSWDGAEVTFRYRAVSGEGSWTELGTPQANTIASLFASSAAYMVGALNGGTLERLAGTVQRVQVFDAPDGTLLKDFNCADYASGPSLVSATTGETWTLAGIAVIVPNELQFYQPTSAARPTAASWPETGVFNLLAWGSIPSEAFNGASWTKTNVTITDGFSGVFARVSETAANAVHGFQPASNSLETISGVRYALFFDVIPGTEDWVQLAMQDNGFTANIWANFNVTTGTLGVNFGADVTARSITQNSDGSWRCGIEGVATATDTTTTPFAIVLTNNTDAATRYPSYAGDTAENMLVSRAFWGIGTLASLVGKYQTVTSANLITQDGVPNVSGVRGDGTDDFLNSGITAIDGSHFFAAAGQGCCIAIPLVMLPGANGIIFAKASATAANKQLQAAVDVNGMLDIFVRGGESADLETVADGLPHYLIVNLDGATATYMFDGMTETALTVGAAAEEILETFMLFARTIGTPASFGRYRLGLDQLVIIDRSLTLAERQNLMQNAVANFGVTLL